MIKDLKFFSLTFSIPIVLSTWIHDCYEYTHHFKHEMFMVEPTDFFVHNRTLLAMRQEIAEDAMQIRQRISERMQEG